MKRHVEQKPTDRFVKTLFYSIVIFQPGLLGGKNLNTKSLLAPESTVFRKVAEELIVLQLDTAHFYYFNPETKEWLDYLRQPRSLQQIEDLGKAHGLDHSELGRFCKELLTKGILRESSEAAVPGDGITRSQMPRLLRDPGKTLDQLSFTCIP